MIGGSNNLRFNLFPDPVSHFGLSGRLGVAGGAALQAVASAPGAARLVFIQNLPEFLEAMYQNVSISGEKDTVLHHRKFLLIHLLIIYINHPLLLLSENTNIVL